MHGMSLQQEEKVSGTTLGAKTDGTDGTDGTDAEVCRTMQGHDLGIWLKLLTKLLTPPPLREKQEYSQPSVF